MLHLFGLGLLRHTPLDIPRDPGSNMGQTDAGGTLQTELSYTDKGDPD